MIKEDFVNLVRTAIAKLKEQGEPSYGPYGCQYIDTQNRCCIVGHMMPDDETRKSADYRGKYDELPTGIVTLKLINFEWVKQFDEKQIGVMKGLQNIHDDMPENGCFNGKIETMYSLIDGYEADI